jgi:hypothetical protein
MTYLNRLQNRTSVWYKHRTNLVCRCGLILLLFFIPLSAQPEADFRFSGDTLTIKTDRYEVVWQNGCMVGLTSLHKSGEKLTVATDTMKVTLLPNGPGSFYQHEKEGKDQHRALWSYKLDRGEPRFPAQHPAYEKSVVRCEDISGGVRLTYTGLKEDDAAVLVQELVVEKGTGDLLIKQKAKSSNSGLFGIGFSLLNLKPDIGFALPYFSGVRVGGKYTSGFSGWAWPGFWSAGLIIGETAEGSTFFVFADDPRLSPKYLKLYSTRDVQGLGFEACGQYPYANKREIEVFNWRFNTFAGSWMEPAERYKQWLAKAYSLKPRREDSPDWYKNISMYCTSPSANLALLGEKIDPKHVLVVNYGWAKGFNRNAPFYQPVSGGEGLAKGLEKLNSMGYHYGVYVAHKLVDLNPLPEVRQKYWGEENLLGKYRVRTALDALSGRAPQFNEDWREDDEKRVSRAIEKNGLVLAGIHPGSNDWIEFYSNLMVDYHKRYGIYAFYQDVSGSNYGSSGIIDGRSIHEGTVDCEKRIREKIPQIVTIGEHWNEVNVAAGMELGSGSYAAWFSPEHHKMLGGERAHPINGYIFGDYTGLVMYKTPLTSTEQFHRDQNFLEITGSIPTWRADVTDEKDTAEIRLTLLRAGLFAEGYRPYYPAVWDKDAVAYMRDENSRIVKYIRKEGSTFCYKVSDEGKERLHYARITGRNALPMPEPVYIDGWIAYDEKGPIGLSRERWYSVFAGVPEEMPVRITGLPAGVHINGLRAAEGYILADIGGSGSGEIEVLTTVPVVGQPVPGKSRHKIEAPSPLIFGLKEAQVVDIDRLLPLKDWAVLKVVNGLVTGKTDWWRAPRDWKFGDVTCRGFSVSPPAGGLGAETSIDGYIKLPDNKNIALSFQMGRLGGIGDGVHFVVRVNGKEIWRQFSEPNKRSWIPVVIPMKEYAGQNIVLSLALDCGPSRFNTSNDLSFWGDPKVVVVGN